MGDEWTRRLHGIGVSDDSGSYMSITHYDSFFQKFIHYALYQEIMGIKLHYLTWAIIQRGYVTNIQAGSHPTAIITLGSSLLGQGYPHHQPAGRGSISAEDDS
jgi:hypothetical protein